MATQNFRRNLLLILYREGEKNLTLVVCCLLPLKREIKNVWHFQPISSVWRTPSLLASYPISILVINVNFQHSDYVITLSLQFSSVTQSCPTLRDPMDYSMPSFPVHHKLLEFTQTHVHQVSNAIQPSHPLLSPFPPAFNLSQHQGLFRWLSSSHQMAEVLYWSSAPALVLPMNI